MNPGYRDVDYESHPWLLGFLRTTLANPESGYILDKAPHPPHLSPSNKTLAGMRLTALANVLGGRINIQLGAVIMP